MVTTVTRLLMLTRMLIKQIFVAALQTDDPLRRLPIGIGVKIQVWGVMGSRKIKDSTPP